MKGPKREGGKEGMKMGLRKRGRYKIDLRTCRASDNVCTVEEVKLKKQKIENKKAE